jgi:hypothetical protein
MIHGTLKQTCFDNRLEAECDLESPEPRKDMSDLDVHATKSNEHNDEGDNIFMSRHVERSISTKVPYGNITVEKYDAPGAIQSPDHTADSILMATYSSIGFSGPGVPRSNEHVYRYGSCCSTVE